MSKKKKGKPSKKKPAKKKAASRATRVAVRPARASAVATNRTAQATVFVFNAGGRTMVRTAPHHLVAGPGYVEWTVVDLTGGDATVEITWKDGGPFDGAPIVVRGSERKPLAGAKEGTFKYNVTAGGYTEDPEIEIPEM